MNKKLITFYLLFFISASGFSQQYNYTVDLVNVKKDQLKVTLSCPEMNSDQILFHFPLTVPGTYAELHYGMYINHLKATDEDGKEIKTEKQGKNSFLIHDAKKLKTITYLVNDTWDSGEKKFKVFEPAGTGFERNQYFYLNNGGMFGFVENMLTLPYRITFTKPGTINGFSSLKCLEKNNDREVYSADSYYELIDNPILFTIQKAERMRVSNAEVLVASYYSKSDSASYYIQKELEKSMSAITAFVGELPVAKYSFLSYIDDQQEAGKILMSGKLGIFQMIKLYRKLGKKGYGALEHGTSSTYFLPDFGKNSYKGMVKETAIHEFMHIYTPLSLHSLLIGNFDYVNPKMSRHLWLYEGVTEYFATLIQMQGRLDSINEVLKSNIASKIRSSYSYPDSIPFTLMSEKVFENPYKDHYVQVYQRGAIMAMLLDFEIMRLTSGQKTLKDVVIALVKKYGKDRSFSEDDIIPDMVAEVHPGLQKFFDSYVTGTTPLDIEGGFKNIGIEYKKEKEGIFPINLLSEEDNGVKANMYIVINNKVTVQKVGKNDIAGLKPGDKVDLNELNDCFKKPDGSYVKEGEPVTLTVLRKEEKVALTFPARFKKTTIKDSIEMMNEMTPEQLKLYKLWTKS